MSFVGSAVRKPSLFYQQFELGSVLGEGNFSTVKECFDKKSHGVKHAVKIVTLNGNKRAQNELKQMLASEVTLMQNIKHKNIIKCIDAFFGSSEILLVLEYTEHGDLYDFVVNSEHIAESKAVEIMSDIASSVQYLHSNNILHRDIKPENFLLFGARTSSKVTVKLCDFGLAVNAKEPLTEVCGSPSYVAPEVLRMNGYGYPVDIWSCGVVMYVLLCQFPPFYAENNKQLFAKIILGQFDFPSPQWNDFSDESKHLISRMLSGEQQRISAEEVLLHPWFDQVSHSAREIDHPNVKNEPRKGLKEVAVAITCVHRFNEPIRKQAREKAILSRSFIEESNL